MFKRAALSLLDLEDAELNNEVRRLLEMLGKSSLGWNSLIFQDVVDLLSSYSLIEFDDVNDSYGIHPMVHSWCSRMLVDKGQRSRQVLSIIGLLVGANKEDYAFSRKLLQHVSNTIASVAIEEVDTATACEVADIYSQQGYWKDADELEVMVVEKRRHKLGEDHLNTLRSMANLASTYWDLGRWKEAEELEVMVMERGKHKLGQDHPHTITSMGNLAATYRSQGKLIEAEALEGAIRELSGGERGGNK